MPNLDMRVITDADIVGPIRSTETLEDGSVVYALGESAVRLSPEDLDEFERLCSGICRAITPKGAASDSSVADAAVDWLLDPSGENDLVAYCLSRIQESVAEYSVLVPLAGLCVQSAFSVGAVTISELTEEQIGSWHRTSKYYELPSEQRAHVDDYYAMVSKNHRGRAIARVTVWAEQEQARVQALDLVEASIAMLRFFCRAAHDPSIRCLCQPYGRERSESYAVFFEKDGDFSGSARGLLDGDGTQDWLLGDRELARIRTAGLDSLSDLLVKAQPSEFEQRLLAAIALYSDATLEPRQHIRLVMMLSSLECLFLANSNEPIQQNLGERLALFTEKGLEERRAVAKMIRDIYAIRSKFVHHAQKPESHELLRLFCRSAWMGLVSALSVSQAYAAVGDFTRAIDDEKYR